MNPARKRTWLRLGIVLVAGLAVLVWIILNRSRGVVFENHSGQRIDYLNVTFSGETTTFRDVPNEGQVSGTFKIGDERFTVEGRLANDTRIRFRGKASEDLHFLILPGGTIELRPKKN